MVKHAVEAKSQKSFAIKIFDRLNQDFSPKLLEQEVRDCDLFFFVPCCCSRLSSMVTFRRSRL